MLAKFKKVLAAVGVIVGSLAIAAPAGAANFTMGNYDRAGSRSIPGHAQFTKANVHAQGLAVAWTAATEGSVTASPVIAAGRVMVGDMNGWMYAFEEATGALLWKTCLEAATMCAGPGFPFAGIIANPLVKGSKVYVGTLSGSMVALDTSSGAVLWTHTPLVNPNVGVPLDAIWGGAIEVNGMVVYGISPSDQFGFGPNARGAVLAVDRNTGQEVWRTLLIGDADFFAGSSGAGVWATSPTYSANLGLIYVGTGQDRNPIGGAVGSDSIFAISASNGEIVWQTQVRDTDTWNTTRPFDPLAPTDTDFGQSPSVFKLEGRSMVAAGDKRGVFWVMDAASGEILNGGGAGLDMFGGVLPGPGLTGGFNLDAGFIRRGSEVTHFAVFADQSEALRPVAERQAPWTDGVCFISAPPFCPALPTGNLVLISGDGSHEICRFEVASTEIFSPFHIDGMIIVRGAQDGILHVVDADHCSAIRSLAVPTGPGGGAAISFAGGHIFTGGGFFGQSGLVAIGLAD